MLEGRTVDCLAIANTAILMQLLDALIERGVIPRPGANALLSDAADSLANCPSAGHSNFEEAIRIIRKELMPKVAERARPL
jgi:hypothetical protein